MTTEVGCVVVNSTDLAWSKESQFLTLPEGLQVKLLVHDPVRHLQAFLVKFPAGYHEPAHTHGGTHATVVLEGSQIVGGKTMVADGFCYGPGGVEHGPFDYPDGCVVFSTFQGDPSHTWLPSDQASGTKPNVGEVGFLAINADEMPWQDGEAVLKLPRGVMVKLLAQDAKRNLTVLAVRFPPGYVEPRHIHGGTHSDCILAGKMVVHGKTLERGDLIYGPNGVEHGPMDYPAGCTVFALMQGDLAHEY